LPASKITLFGDKIEARVCTTCASRQCDARKPVYGTWYG